MKIELYHASKFGNGAMVAEEFKRIMAAKGAAVNVHHVKDANPKDIPRLISTSSAPRAVWESQSSG